VRAVRRPVEEDDLQAWVDGRLRPEDAEAVETYFAAHPELRAAGRNTPSREKNCARPLQD
jgi:anti-sigma factor RsiW